MDENRTWSNAKKFCFIRYSQYSFYEAYAKRFGIGYKNLFVLRALYTFENGCTQMEICQDAFISKQTVSAIIKSYLNAGYITMEELSSDRRNKLIRFTPKGKEYADKIIPKVLEAEMKAMADFTEEQQELFLKMCTQYAENLKKIMI